MSLPIFLKKIIDLTDTFFKSRIGHNISWNLLGILLSRGIPIISLMIVARILGKEEFGQLGIIQSSIAMFQVFALFGMGVTASKHIAELKTTDPGKSGRVISLTFIFTLVAGGLISFLLFAIAPWYAQEILKAPLLIVPIKCSSAILFFSALAANQQGVLVGFESFRSIAMVNLWVGILSGITIIGGALIGGINLVIVGMAISSLFHIFLNNKILREECKKFQVHTNISRSLEELPLLWKFALPAVLAGILVPPVNWLALTMLARQPGGLSDVGIYSAANQWFSALLFLPAILNNALLPIMAENKGSGDQKAFRATLITGLKATLGPLIPLVLLISIMSPVIMSFYGAGFRQGWVTLLYIVFAALCAGIQNLVGNALATLDKMWIHFSMNAIWAVIFLTTAVLLLQAGMGATGLAAALLISYGLRLILVIGFLTFFLRGKNEFKTISD